MNSRGLRSNSVLRERLAAEYVLGTLRGGARRRFEGWLLDDALLRQTVAQWEDRLMPMAEFAPTAQPSARVWQIIEQRLGLRYRQRGGRRTPWWLAWQTSLNFWRSLGVGSTAVAAVLLAVVLTRQPETVAPIIAPTFVATLADDKAQPVMVVTASAEHHTMTVKVVTPQQISPEQSLELWAIPREGPPRSLGLVAADGTVTLPLPAQTTPDQTPMLAISLEPKGGSPNKNAPTGPVLYKGVWVRA